MDTQLIGGYLIALNGVQDGLCTSTKLKEDAFYRRNASADGRAIRIVSAVAMVCFGLVAIGSWVQ